jgi:hypothetical protein
MSRFPDDSAGDRRGLSDTEIAVALVIEEESTVKTHTSSSTCVTASRP